ncbi:hypothetical protein NUU61_000477 [Penicillium alfredii]|uniref:Zn(2)-C6 fungal-type domain-containing protein n=1 Tax=Penicillium alfredii TaxID=1506179 RepID=A0A9W9KR38_9EURO|nr:uncharacterized protein NUU61_000477 [Penicillium alfredii]KAJ5114718.1 hypothetical protein NUU61_000477 [Penicillium alfredii]
MNDNLEEEPLAPNQGQEAKRRKIRKGTRSCWGCKHRKIRCIFPSSDSATCVECQRRRTTCISQKLPEDLVPTRQTSNSRHLGERIATIENIIKDLVVTRSAQTQGEEPRNEPPQPEGHTNQPSNSTPSMPCHDDRVSICPRSAFTADSPDYESSGKVGIQGYSRQDKGTTPSNSHGEGRKEKRKWTQSTSLRAPTQSRDDARIDSSILQRPSSPDEAAVIHHLLSAFPSRDNAKILAKESSRPSLYAHLANFQPHSKLTRDALTAAATSDAIHPTTLSPCPNPHPVLLARQMIIFAITLQSPSGEKVHGLSEPRGLLMRRLMAAATTWVTKREWQGTLESVLCIMLEGVFEVNCGNLRRAWAVYRRAMTVAQLMGLHRSPLPPINRIDSRLDMDPAFMWFRIVYMDRYLSLLLGLPQGTTDKSMASTLQNDTPLGKFERQLAVIASHILERNEYPLTDKSFTNYFGMTQSIDTQLLEVSRSVPSSFWRPANFQGLTPGSPDALLETVRLACQVYYNSLLIQLHLPCAISGIGSHTEHEYSKVTCVNASREIMTRFISHRTFNPMSSCSRPVDFFAFLAAMTILLTYLDAHREATNFLAHQRLGDRATLEQVLDLMDLVSRIDNDAMTRKSAELIRRLLDIEADAFEGITYVRTMAEESQPTQETLQDEKQLYLHIPYLGSIKIARQASPPSVTGRSHDAEFQLEQPNISTDGGTLVCPQISLIEEHQPQMDIPTVTAGVDDWAFQGVDMAFFDSLTKGMLDVSGPGPN